MERDSDGDDLAAMVLKNPAAVQEFSLQEVRSAALRLMTALGPLVAKWLGEGSGAQASERGGSVLSSAKIAKRLGCSVQTLTRGWRAGRYPFVWKDGGRLVGSEDGLLRWIKARQRGA